MITRLGFLLLVHFPLSLGLTTPVPAFLGGPEVKVMAKPAPPKGDGVFTVETIPKGSFVCQYKGQLLTLEEELEKYPDRYPDYCLQLSPDSNLSIDGVDSNHWSRLINHNENANLNLHTNAEEGTAHFTAARDIPPGEELCFDYGVAYFIFRNIVPAPGTESRSLELPTESLEEAQAQAPPKTPTSPDEVQDLIASDDEDMDTKKATLMRGLDFYGGVVWMEDGDTVEIPIDLEGQKENLSYSDVTLEYLVERLENLWKQSQA